MTSASAASRRTGSWIAVVAGFAGVLVAGGVLLVQNMDGSNGDESRRTLTKPGEAAGYTLLRTAPARRYSRTTERDLSAQASGAGVVVGTYARGDEQLVFVGFSFPVASEQGEALAGSAPEALRDYFASAGVEGLESFDAGPLGGALMCGRAQSGAAAQVTCGWADDGTLGSLRFATGRLADGPVADAAEVTVAFRAAAEPVD